MPSINSVGFDSGSSEPKKQTWIAIPAFNGRYGIVPVMRGLQSSSHCGRLPGASVAFVVGFDGYGDHPGSIHRVRTLNGSLPPRNGCGQASGLRGRFMRFGGLGKRKMVRFCPAFALRCRWCQLHQNVLIIRPIGSHTPEHLSNHFKVRQPGKHTSTLFAHSPPEAAWFELFPIDGAE